MNNQDPRIAELLDLACEEGLPLAVSPETVCELEDVGLLVDPFTGQLWPDVTTLVERATKEFLCGPISGEVTT